MLSAHTHVCGCVERVYVYTHAHEFLAYEISNLSDVEGGERELVFNADDIGSEGDFHLFDESNFNKLSKIAVQYLNAEPRRLGLCNYGGLIDTLFTDVEGVA